jgi:YfiH family protein
VFALDDDRYYRVPEWAAFDWLTHGFGTAEAAFPDGNLATVKQVHGCEILIAECAGNGGVADGLIAEAPGLLVGVKTADCLPILLVDPKNRIVAAVHAGWRGTRAGIAARAVEQMTGRFGSDPRQIEAAIGPGIGMCCFEVGPEVAREFGPWEKEEKAHLDLSRINRRQLEKAHVSRIYEAGLCTMCGAGFFSYRRDREAAGRMLSFAGTKAA